MLVRNFGLNLFDGDASNKIYIWDWWHVSVEPQIHRQYTLDTEAEIVL